MIYLYWIFIAILLLKACNKGACRLGNVQGLESRYVRSLGDHSDHTHLQMPSFAECNMSYGSRDFLWLTEMKLPPMLLTFPGSGTTMTQMLLEYATGILSGSIYDEEELYDVMPGLKFCGQRLSVIKAHIKDLLFKTTPAGKDEEAITFHSSRYVTKCRKGIIYNFNRFIIVLRSPWASVWSNYQRDYNTGLYDLEQKMANEAIAKVKKALEEGDSDEAIEKLASATKIKPRSHTGGIPLSEFNRTGFAYTSLNNPHYGVHMYNHMWNTTLRKIFEKYEYNHADDVNYGNASFYHMPFQVKERQMRKQSLEADMKEWELAEVENHSQQGKGSETNNFPPYSVLGNKNVLVVRYEDLIHPERRLHVLRRMVRFTGLKTTTDSTWAVRNPTEMQQEQSKKERQRKYTTSAEEEEERRLKCAFVLADNPLTHRKHHNKHVAASVAKVSDEAQDAGTEGDVTKLYTGIATEGLDASTRYSEAYNDKQLVCSMWKEFQQLPTSWQMQRYGYYHGPHQQESIPICIEQD